ncbi:hypothetical protein FQV26_10220 [Planococcus sp. CPCC 101016]|uniref:hypothetical protein n=1 Tax=Planococcus sp. CPCC 101016 TaxID=2599617 RepID=UPI0011B84EF1|nr:hypothetical protein [Planococcus sp. CPCC 101016]TWT08160.1 hypothetical protein FQV26_10220 [Planococcus sp. CPCC 101016]
MVGGIFNLSIDLYLYLHLLQRRHSKKRNQYAYAIDTVKVQPVDDSPFTITQKVVINLPDQLQLRSPLFTLLNLPIFASPV